MSCFFSFTTSSSGDPQDVSHWGKMVTISKPVMARNTDCKWLRHVIFNGINNINHNWAYFMLFFQWDKQLMIHKPFSWAEISTNI